MLMITVMAFATSYTDKLTYKLTVFTALTKNLPAGELTIEPYGTSNYIVTAKGCDFDAGNWDEIVCEDVAGTKDANGVTTITLDNPYAYRTSDNTAFTDTKLVVKFNGTKAYAHFEGKMNVMYVARAFEYTFGTDEGFEGGSTGGGETGGEVKEDYYINFDKSTKNTHASRYSTSVSLQQVGKDKQTISFNSTKDGYEDLTASKFTVEAGSEVTPSIGYVGEWMHGYVYIDLDNNKQFSFNAESDDQTGTDVVSYSFYTTATGEAAANGKNSKGETVASNCNVNPLPSFTAPATPGTYRIRFKVDWNNIDAGGGVAVGQNICANGGGIWDATLEVVAPAPTVDKEVPFTGVAFSVSNGLTGNADVTFKEMSDETVKMTFSGNGYNIALEGLAKGTDAKGRTTYTGEVSNGTTTYTVNAVVYDEGTAQNLYMTMVSADGTKFTVGEDPDYVAPVTYKNTLKVVRGTDTKTYENAEVSVLAKGENKYAVTIPSFTDMDQMEGTIGKLTFEATGVEDGGTLKLTATSAATTQEGGSGWDNAGFTASMDATVTDGTLAGTFTVVYPNDATNYTYTLYYGVEPPVAPEEPKDVTVVEKYQADGTGFAHNVTIDWDTQKIVASMNLAEAGSDKNIFAVAKEGQSADWVDYGVVFYDNGDGTVSGFVPGTDDNSNTSKQSKGSDPVRFEVSKDGVKFQGNVVIAASSLSNLISNKNVVVGAEGSKPGKAYYNYIKVVSLDWKEPTEPTEPEVYTSNLHIYDAAAPETDLFQADQAKVEFLATETGEFKLTLKNVTLNEKTQDLVFTGALPTPQPGGQDPLAEEGEGEVTPAEPAMVLNATADEATSRFFGSPGTYVTAVFNVSYDKNDNFMMTFIIDNNYAGEFNYEKKTPETPDVTVEVEKTFTDSFSLNNVSLGNAKVTIKEMSDKTINMVFTFGTNDFTSTDLVKGTDDKNRTTYTGTISIGGVECVVNGVVYTKDNAEKLYMTLVSTTSGTYVFGTEPTDTPEPPVVEEYPINFDKDANSTHSSRVLNSFSLQQTGKDKQTKSVKTSKAAYEDHTADEPFTVEAGSELTASFDYTGEWMHSFVYIDFDNDGQFSYKEGQWDQTGTDLVAFSFYSLDSNPKNDASGYNSVGDELTGDARNTYVAPSFKAPAKAGEYRIRFKIDWNCILPGGSSSILSDGGGVWDATLKVVEPVVDGISTINVEAANGEAQLFTIDGVKLNKLQKGLNIVRTADGKVKKVLVK